MLMAPRRAAGPFVLALFAVITAAPFASAGEEPGEQVPINPTRLLVKLRAGASQADVAAAHARVGAKLVRDLPQIGWQIVAVPPGRNVAIRDAYAREPAIERADLDRGRKVAYVPNDPYWPNEWHMVDIKADQAWDTVKGDPSVVVAVMDTGLDTTHPDLSPNVWTNPGEIPGNGVDDDGNGYVDDVHGYDFAYDDGDPNDNFGHGTACAGIVAAAQDNSIGMSGVAPQCRIAGVKAATDSGYFYDSANVPAFLYIADMGFKVVSMSFYSDEVTPAEHDAVEYCWKKGVVLVAAAGNDSRVLPYYPGAYDHVICVAATDGADNRAWFSNYGSWVDVAAPGVSLTATTVGGGYTFGFAGTSGATPHVAGLAALLFSANPAATNADVRAALEDTAIPTVDPTLGEYTNYGRIDCKAAVDRVQGLTSGSAPARLLFAAPVGGDPARLGTLTGGNFTAPRIEFVGTGLEAPNVVRVLFHGGALPLQHQSRQLVAVDYPSDGGGAPVPGAGRFDLEVNGSAIGGFDWQGGPGLVYVPSDLGTFNATVSGGFEQIANVDGRCATCDDNGAGQIYLQIPVRKVRPRAPKSITLEFTRAYQHCPGGNETILLYDWSTWSFPYGSWLTLSSRTIPGAGMETVVATVPADPEHYVDDQGTMYFIVSVSGAHSNGRLRADAFRVRVE
jgi:subtilisin family serine protease